MILDQTREFCRSDLKVSNYSIICAMGIQNNDGTTNIHHKDNIETLVSTLPKIKPGTSEMQPCENRCVIHSTNHGNLNFMEWGRRDLGFPVQIKFNFLLSFSSLNKGYLQ